MPINDNDPTAPILPTAPSEPHGRAALLLVESLIHGLCEHSLLSAGQAVDVAERAVNVQLEHAETAGDAAEPMWQSHTLLSAIAASLRIDDGRGSPPPFLLS